MINKKGFMLVLEGSDGVGKTTLSKIISEDLNKLGYSTQLSREPTNGQYGKLIRESAIHGRYSLEEELDLFIKDRKEHINEVINPALNAGKIVILDRYFYSTMAYQGARGADINNIKNLHEEFAIIPNLLILLKLDVDKALSRIKKSRESIDLFENKDYLQKVNDIYDKIEHPNILRINADQEIGNIVSEIKNKVLDDLNHA